MENIEKNKTLTQKYFDEKNGIIYEKIYENLNIKDLHTGFFYISNSKFEISKFDNCTANFAFYRSVFKKNKFINFNFENCNIRSCIFENCEFEDCVFNKNISVSNSFFYICNFDENCVIYNETFQGCTFSGCKGQYDFKE